MQITKLFSACALALGAVTAASAYEHSVYFDNYTGKPMTVDVDKEASADIYSFSNEKITIQPFTEDVINVYTNDDSGADLNTDSVEKAAFKINNDQHVIIRLVQNGSDGAQYKISVPNDNKYEYVATVWGNIEASAGFSPDYQFCDSNQYFHIYIRQDDHYNWPNCPSVTGLNNPDDQQETDFRNLSISSTYYACYFNGDAKGDKPQFSAEYIGPDPATEKRDNSGNLDPETATNSLYRITFLGGSYWMGPYADTYFIYWIDNKTHYVYPNNGYTSYRWGGYLPLSNQFGNRHDVSYDMYDSGGFAKTFYTPNTFSWVVSIGKLEDHVDISLHNVNFDANNYLTSVVYSTLGLQNQYFDPSKMTHVDYADFHIQLPKPTVPVEENTPYHIIGLSVTDVGEKARTELKVSNGVLSVSLKDSATISSGSNNSSDLTISGTEADINATLATLNYQGKSDFAGSETLIMQTTDSNDHKLPEVDTKFTVRIKVNGILFNQNSFNSYTNGVAALPFGVQLQDDKRNPIDPSEHPDAYKHIVFYYHMKNNKPQGLVDNDLSYQQNNDNRTNFAILTQEDMLERLTNFYGQDKDDAIHTIARNLASHLHTPLYYDHSVGMPSVDFKTFYLYSYNPFFGQSNIADPASLYVCYVPEDGSTVCSSNVKADVNFKTSQFASSQGPSLKCDGSYPCEQLVAAYNSQLSNTAIPNTPAYAFTKNYDTDDKDSPGYTMSAVIDTQYSSRALKLASFIMFTDGVNYAPVYGEANVDLPVFMKLSSGDNKEYFRDQVLGGGYHAENQNDFEYRTTAYAYYEPVLVDESSGNNITHMGFLANSLGYNDRQA